MKINKRRKDEKQFRRWPNISCCGTQDNDTPTPDCCQGIKEEDRCFPLMKKCMNGCRWFPLIPVVLGITFLLLGTFLNPEIIRIGWMIAAGFMILMGVLCLVMIRKIKQIGC